MNSCDVGQQCRMVRGTPVCVVVVGARRQGEQVLQQGDEHLDGWWANYLSHHPKQSFVAKRTNSKNSGGFIEGSNANNLPKQGTPTKKRPTATTTADHRLCPRSSCAPGLRCRVVGRTPVCFETSPLTVGLRKTEYE